MLTECVDMVRCALSGFAEGRRLLYENHYFARYGQPEDLIMLGLLETTPSQASTVSYWSKFSAKQIVDRAYLTLSNFHSKSLVCRMSHMHVISLTHF
jgi:hypothetical protein